MSSEPIVFPSVIRAALLEDHVRLRRQLAQLEALAEDQLAGTGNAAELWSAGRSFRDALAAHNRAEEAHLESLLRDVDSWGEVRVSQMLIEHLEEHKALLIALLPTEALAMARAIPVFARDLREHMDLEERTFLGAEVLHDSLVTVGPTS